MAAGLRASGPKADLALIVAPNGAQAAGVFTKNIMCAAPVTYCRDVLAREQPVRAVSSPSCYGVCGKLTLTVHAVAGRSCDESCSN